MESYFDIDLSVLGNGPMPTAQPPVYTVGNESPDLKAIESLSLEITNLYDSVVDPSVDLDKDKLNSIIEKKNTVSKHLDNVNSKISKYKLKIEEFKNSTDEKVRSVYNELSKKVATMHNLSTELGNAMKIVTNEITDIAKIVFNVVETVSEKIIDIKNKINETRKKYAKYAKDFQEFKGHVSNFMSRCGEIASTTSSTVATIAGSETFKNVLTIMAKFGQVLIVAAGNDNTAGGMFGGPIDSEFTIYRPDGRKYVLNLIIGILFVLILVMVYLIYYYKPVKCATRHDHKYKL
jgi:archaellum component FlaC